MYIYYEILEQIGIAGLFCIGVVLFFAAVHMASGGGFYNEKD